MTSERLRLFALLACGFAALVLGGALASERWGGLVPCALCLWERWPWRAAALCAGLAAVVSGRLARPLLVLALLAGLAGAGFASVHVGVEAGLWPSPLPECAAPKLGGGTIAERLAQLPARPAKPCDEPTYLIPAVPVSMALANLLAALAFSAGVAMLVWTSRRSVR